MRTRVVLAAIALSSAAVTVTLAQHSPSPASQRTNKAGLRAKLIEMHVELDLMELEYEADRAELLRLIQNVRNEETIDPQDRAANADLLAMTYGGSKEANLKAGLDAFVSLKSDLDRKRKNYAHQGAVVANKRLETVEAEKRYNDAR